MEELKKEVINLLCPIFGNQVESMISEYYDSPEEILALAKHMLSGYVGEKKADEMLKTINANRGVVKT